MQLLLHMLSLKRVGKKRNWNSIMPQDSQASLSKILEGFFFGQLSGVRPLSFTINRTSCHYLVKKVNKGNMGTEAIHYTVEEEYLS